MRIVYCIKGVYNSGGMERVLANKANYLADKAGYDIHIVTTEQQGRQPFYNFSDKITFHDLDIRYWDLQGMPLLRRKALLFSKKRIHKKRLEAALLRLKPDITVSMFDEDAVLLPAIKDGSIKILETHFSKNVSEDYLKYNGGGILKILSARLSIKRDELLSRKFCRFITLTEEDRELRGGARNIVVIPNAVTHFPLATADYSAQRVIAVGRLDPQKGFDLLVDAWKQVAEDFPDWKLAIFGSGPDERKLNRQIESLHLTNVQLFPPTKAILNEYLSSSLFVLSSRYEGLPMVLLEAMASALPVVSFKCPCGPVDLIKDGSEGFLVDKEHTQQLAEKIKLLLRDVVLREKMGRQARESVAQYSEEFVMNKWIGLFEELIQERSK